MIYRIDARGSCREYDPRGDSESGWSTFAPLILLDHNRNYSLLHEVVHSDDDSTGAFHSKRMTAKPQID